MEHSLRGLNLSAAYVATMGVKLASLFYPNSYGGASPAFAPFTRFDSTGRAVGGYGMELLMTNQSHSTFHSLQAKVSKTSPQAGLGFEANYTLSKSLDDVSAPAGGAFSNFSGFLLQTPPHKPWNAGAEKGPSIFDLTHVLSISLIQELPFNRWSVFRPLGQGLTAGWQLLNITTLASGPPFTVYSGVQQTGAGGGPGGPPGPDGGA